MHDRCQSPTTTRTCILERVLFDDSVRVVNQLDKNLLQLFVRSRAEPSSTKSQLSVTKRCRVAYVLTRERVQKTPLGTSDEIKNSLRPCSDMHPERAMPRRI